MRAKFGPQGRVDIQWYHPTIVSWVVWLLGVWESTLPHSYGNSWRCGGQSWWTPWTYQQWCSVDWRWIGWICAAWWHLGCGAGSPWMVVQRGKEGSRQQVAQGKAVWWTIQDRVGNQAMQHEGGWQATSGKARQQVRWDKVKQVRKGLEMTMEK